MEQQGVLLEAARRIREAKALIVTAGAGMGVDSGLPDFRGDRGFWNAYPMYERLGVNFISAANPEHFARDPAFAWGFYGHRSNLYRKTVPHEGFAILLRWIRQLELDYFVVTSNVDGQFQKAGFDPTRIAEVHGSIHYLQCTVPCSQAIWDNGKEFAVDLETMRSSTIPRCPRCGGTARPNILMFDDFTWLAERTDRQERRHNEFLASRRGSGQLVIVEMGAGTAIPTIREHSEMLGRQLGATVIRINPREPQIHAPHIAVPLGALAGLRKIDEALAALD